MLRIRFSNQVILGTFFSVCLIAGCLIIPSYAAELDELTVQTDVSSSDNVAKEIGDINARVALLSARLSEIEMKAKIASKLSEIDKIENAVSDSASTSTPPPIPNLPLQSQNSDASIDLLSEGMTIPGIKEIDGIDGNLRATLYLDNGGTQIVRLGDRVGSWTVKKIDIDSVTVQSGKQIKKLPFGGSMTLKTPISSLGPTTGSTRGTSGLAPPIPQLPGSNF